MLLDAAALVVDFILNSAVCVFFTDCAFSLIKYIIIKNCVMVYSISVPVLTFQGRNFDF